MTKRSTLSAFAASLSAIIMAGAAVLTIPNATAAADQATLTVSFSNTNYKPFLEEAARQFEKDHPGVTISYLASVPTHGEHLSRTLRLALTGEAPDISLQSYDQIAILARRSLGVPLDNFIDSEKDWKSIGLTDASMDAVKISSKVYALPFESATPTLFYNLDLVQRAGGDPNHLPSDWDGIVALAGKIHSLGPNITGAFFDYNASGNWTFQALITGQGSHLMNADETKVAFNGVAGLRAFDIIRKLGQTGMQDMSQDQAFQAFAGGQIGIITQANTYLAPFEQKSAGQFAIKAVRWPLSEGGRIPIGGRSLMMLTTDVAKQKIAWQYMKFLVSPPMQTLLTKMTSTTPVNMIAIKQPEYLGSLYSSQPNQQAAVDALPYVTGWYTFPGENAQKIVDVIHDYLRDVAIKQVDPNDAMAKMSKAVTELLK